MKMATWLKDEITLKGGAKVSAQMPLIVSASRSTDVLRDTYEHHKVAASGGGVVKNARLEIEHKTGCKVISSLNASEAGALDIESNDMLPPSKE